MSIILREEWFGGIIADIHSYNTKVANKFAFEKIVRYVANEIHLENSEVSKLESLGFSILDIKKARIVKNPNDSVILSAPLIFWIELTSKCPLKCKHCFISCQHDLEKNHFIPIDTVESLLANLHSIGTPKITLTGGEALLYRDIERVLSKINLLDMGLRIFSSGFVNRKHIEVLENYFVDNFFLSMDGDEQHHNELRGENSFQRLIESLQILSTYSKIKNITISTTLDAHNANKFHELLEICENYNVRTILVRPIMIYPWSQNVKNISFKSKEHLFNSINKIMENAEKHGIEIQINKIPYLPLSKNIYIGVTH